MIDRQIILSISLALLAMINVVPARSASPNADWIELFNGHDLENWIPKFTGHELGDNYLDTFRAENGVLKISYDNWTSFNGEFGHLFYKQPFSNYLLQLEYRFIGDQVTNGPDWAFRNNGVMLHSQAPDTMSLDQKFPVSIEVQLLGGNGRDPRPTANVCSPGTQYQHRGKLVTQHCTNSSSATFHGNHWVKLEIEVHGDKVIRHRVNGELVFEYSKPELDESDRDAKRLLDTGVPKVLSSGYISLQAESHPTEFRHIELMPLTSSD